MSGALGSRGRNLARGNVRTAITNRYLSRKEVHLTPVILTFLATAIGILGVCSFVADLFLRDRSRVLRRVDEELRQRQRESVRRSRLFKDPRETFAEAEANEEIGVGLGERQRAMVAESGSSWTSGWLL